MDLLIMKDLEYTDLPIYKENLIFTMAGLIDAISGNPLAIGYTVCIITSLLSDAILAF